jgi:ElaB/YqjD/DUF883 family membrane-anchored ribosome-binding protein
MTASTTINDTADKADKSIKDAEKKVRELADRAEHAIIEALESVRARSRVYADTAGDGLDTAQRFVTEHVQERPLAATAAALGVGVLIGLLLAPRR